MHFAWNKWLQPMRDFGVAQMDFTGRMRRQNCEPPFRGPNSRRRPANLSRLACAMAVGCAIVVCPAIARAQSQAKDLWQTYMEAAIASDQTDDFKTEAIALNAALALANQNDAQGPRPGLTRLPLLLAYAELGRKDLMQPLTDQGMRIDVSNLDSRFDNYIGAADNYASSYYDRWNAHRNDNPVDDFKTAVRTYGAKNLYRIEVALRTKLRPDDSIGLATALGEVGLMYKSSGEFECAAYDYGRALETFLDFQRKRDAMTMAGGFFSVSNPATPSAEQSTKGQAVVDTQVYLVMSTAALMTASAYRSLQPEPADSRPAKTDLSADCDNFGPPARTAPAVGFDAQIGRASEYFDSLLKLTSELHSRWPSHPLLGIIDYRLADLFALEFKMTKAHPEQYPDSLAEARKSYESSLSIMTHARGIGSQFVRTTAAEYAGLLNEAQLPDEAKKIEDRYGVTASN
jgi:hypothetical protein